MDSLPSIRFEPDALPEGCAWIGSSASTKPQAVLNPWQDPTQKLDLLLLLAATRTAEQEGISAAGSTAISRRYTALADAELLLRGPSQPRRWPLPPLPAGVSPALLSHVAVRDLSLSTSVAALGLVKAPDFGHLRLESPDQGPAECLSTGAAMPLQRVQHLWCQGERIGSRLRRPLVLAECVPGGTTTAQAVLTALKISVDTLISGSARQPPHGLKRKLVAAGLKRARLGRAASVLDVLAAVGDPFQAVGAGLLVGAVRSGQPVLLGGGSQMLAVLALALEGLPHPLRSVLADQVLIGTTAWLAEEGGRPPHQSAALDQVVRNVAERFELSLHALASGLRFHTSAQQCLRDYECGYVKEGVGAGALLLLAQLRGRTLQQLVADCDSAAEQLQPRAVTSEL